MENIPIPRITSLNSSIIGKIENIVDKIISIKRQNQKADIDNLEEEIDNLVYNLYGLTEEEIQIIENNSKDQIKGEPCLIN